MTLPQDPKDTVETMSVLEGPLRLNFSGQAARDRAATGDRPDKVFRWSHEKQGTLPSSITRAKHNAHADNKTLKLQAHEAFHAPGTLKAALDFTKERFMKHLDARRTGPNPTPFISTTTEEKFALKKVKHIHDHTRRIPRCLVITSMDISGAEPATLIVNMKTTPVSHEAEHKEANRIESEVYEDVEIPIWVIFRDDYEGPAHERPDSTVEDVLAAGGMFLFSVNELKVSALRVWASDDHRNEWLFVGSVPKELVIKAKPFDGRILHSIKTEHCIQAVSCPEPYLWNHDNESWDHIPGLTNHDDLPDWRPYRLEKAGEKRSYDEAKIGAAVAAEIVESRKRNRRSNSAVGAEDDAAHAQDNAATRAADAMPFEVTISHPVHAPRSFMVRPEEHMY
ncbi:hypothetical protein J4E89_007098 [Alternaria sp. Ai002NY15]|nr:hypothetical protein J4E89_007098 [Alternaria sp. Ai002NY15]